MEVKLEVKDVIVSALKLLGKSGLAERVSGGEVLGGADAETVSVLLYCFNAVEDEVARKYMTLTAREELSSVNGKFNYTKFSHIPVKIIKVLVGGKEADYELFTQYIAVNSITITVEYEYAPSKKELGGVSDFGPEVGERLLALGAAAEYCLINGEIECSELWEKKYRAEIDCAQNALPSGGTIPPRRWV